MPDRLRHFLGKSSKVNGIDIYSPTINSISEDDVGEVTYNIYITLATFNKEVVLKQLFGVSDEDYLDIESDDDFSILVEIPSVVKETEKALSFFVRDAVVFDHTIKAYTVSGTVFADRSNYIEIANTIKKLNGIADDDNNSIKFKNEKAKQLHEKLLKLRAKYKKDKTDDLLKLKDMLSILCNADGNGINIFNVGSLTIYQVYEHFERLNIKESHTRLLGVWANGYLGENDKLPEWIVKSKL